MISECMQIRRFDIQAFWSWRSWAKKALGSEFEMHSRNALTWTNLLQWTPHRTESRSHSTSSDYLSASVYSSSLEATENLPEFCMYVSLLSPWNASSELESIGLWWTYESHSERCRRDHYDCRWYWGCSRGSGDYQCESVVLVSCSS